VRIIPTNLIGYIVYTVGIRRAMSIDYRNSYNHAGGLLTRGSWGVPAAGQSPGKTPPPARTSLILDYSLYTSNLS
jgi:hypothetical protein